MYTVKRFFQIIEIAARQILSVILGRLLVILSFGSIRLRVAKPAQNLRKTLERLGGAFIKFGQLLAMRPDIMPMEYIQELSALLDAAPTFPGAEATRIVQRELRRPISSVFAEFSEEPIAAASFAQVHRATLLTGETVVVKVQRPGLADLAHADIRLFILFARLVDFLGLLKRFRMSKLALEFRDWTNEELDLRVEATYAQRLRDLSTGDPHSYLPKVYWEFTSCCILTLEYLQGTWVSQLLARIDQEGMDSAINKCAEGGIDLKEVASNILSNGLRQAFEYRLFHADPHAGNMVVLANNVIGYVDFGITGELDKEFRATQLLIYDAVNRRDYSQYMVGIYRLMKPPPEDIDLDAFETEIKKNVREWENNRYNRCARLQERSSSWLIMRNLKVTRVHGLEVSQMAVRYFRAISVIELIILRLDPDFDIVNALSSYLRQLMLREVAKEVKMASRMEKLLVRRRFLDEAMDEMGGRFRSMESASGIPRRRVSRWKMVLSNFFELVACVCGIAMIGIPILLFLGVRLPASSSTGTMRDGIGILFLILLFSAWASRKLYIDSSENGLSWFQGSR